MENEKRRFYFSSGEPINMEYSATFIIPEVYKLEFTDADITKIHSLGLQFFIGEYEKFRQKNDISLGDISHAAKLIYIIVSPKVWHEYKAVLKPQHRRHRALYLRGQPLIVKENRILKYLKSLIYGKGYRFGV
ncbi:MAG: hypothetical protein ACP5NS_04865 [Candidatus Pacearchaeota archaeon]